MYKDAGKEELLEVMDRTMKGESVYPDAPPTVMIGTAKSCDFTQGELAVLRLVVEGESYKKIAESLCISPETVKWHIKNMLQKTNFDSKTKLAVAVTKKPNWEVLKSQKTDIIVVCKSETSEKNREGTECEKGRYRYAELFIFGCHSKGAQIL